MATTQRPCFMQPPPRVGLLAVALLTLTPSASAASTGTNEETLRETWNQLQMMGSTGRRMDESTTDTCDADHLEACSESMCTSDLHASAVWKCVRTQGPSDCPICGDYAVDKSLDFYHPLANAYLGCAWLKDQCDNNNCAGVPCGMAAPYIQSSTPCCRNVVPADIIYDDCGCSKCDADHIDGCPEAMCTSDLHPDAFWMCNADTLLCACGVLSTDDVQATVQLHDALGLDAANPSEFCSWPMVRCSGGTYSIRVARGSATGVHFDQAFAGHFPNIIKIDAEAAGFAGSLPPQLARSTKLTVFRALSNQLTGTMPAEYAAWTEMVNFFVQRNKLSGTLPPQYGVWQKVTEFNVRSNDITGTLPKEYASWSNAKGVNFAVNPNLQGTLPREYAAWNKLQYFACQLCGFTGTFPPEYKEWTDLEHDFYAYGNQFTGPLPSEWGSSMTKLARFRVQDNKLTGSLPSSYSAMVALREFSAYDNEFSGELPEDYSAWGNIEIFDLGNNKLQGKLPSSYGAWTKVKQFIAFKNNLGGDIPASYGSWTKLQEFRLSDNALSGTVPSSLGQWVDLQDFDVSDNKLQGPLKPEFSEWSQIAEFVVARNAFSGPIPQNYTTFSATTFDVSHNQLTGNLPGVGATFLNAANNMLETADRPAEQTKKLDLAHNAFSQLPVSWTEGTLSLTQLDLAHNPIAAWPLAGVRGDKGYSPEGIRPCTNFNAWNDPELREAVLEPHLDWPHLKELRVDGCPLGVRARDFLHSLSSLENLMILSASGCRLSGDIPKEAGQFVPATTPECKAQTGFAYLTELILSDNEIESISAPLPASRPSTIKLSHNKKLVGLEDSWLEAQYLDVRDSALLQLPVSPADTEKPCTGDEEVASLKADPSRFMVSVDDEPECTSTCAVLGKQLLASSSMNFEALCRCPPGYEGSGTQCSPCPKDTYGFRPSSTMTSVCEACPAFSSTGENDKVSSADQCECSVASLTRKVGDTCGCEEGMRMDRAQGRCVACGEMENCAWGNLAQDDHISGTDAGTQSLLTPVLIHDSATSYIADPDGEDYTVWKCKKEVTCLAGTFENRLGSCAKGREGLACGRCKSFHFEPSGRYGECEECDPNGAAGAVIIAVVVALFGVCLAAVRSIGLAMKLMAMLILSVLAVKNPAARVVGVGVLFLVVLYSRRARKQGNMSGLRHVAATSKILSRYLVMLTIIGEFSIPWPEINLMFFEWPAFLRFDFAHMVDLGCVAEVGLLGEMAVRWVLPLGCVGLLALAALLNNALAKIFTKSWKAVSKMQVVELSLSVYQILLAQIVKMCLVPLECQIHPNGRFTLSGRPDVECGSEEWTRLKWPSITFFTAYVVAFYLFALWASYRAPVLSQRKELKFTFVYADFRARVYWWAPVVFGKEILCAGTVALLPSSGVGQTLFMSGVLFGYLMWSHHVKPFPTSLQNQLDLICHAALILQIVQSLGLKAESSKAMQDYASHILLVIQVVSVALPAAVASVIVAKATWARCASKLPDVRAHVLRRLAYLEESDAGEPMWGTIRWIVERYKVDEVELKEVAEAVEVFVARSGQTDMKKTVGGRRGGSLVALRESLQARLTVLEAEAARQACEEASDEGSEEDLPQLLTGPEGVPGKGLEKSMVMV